MKYIVQKGTTNFIAAVFIQDSSQTNGSGLTGLTSSSVGLTCYRARPDDGNAGGVVISLSAGTRGTWSSGGFVEKDNANLNGVYELGIPNAALAVGTLTVGTPAYCVIMLKGAANMAPCVMEIELVDFIDLTTGLVKVTSNVKANQALTGFMFVMTNSTTHNPQPGLTIAVTASQNGAAFGALPSGNVPVDRGNGDYAINFSAADLNCNVLAVRFTATGADDLTVTIVTQP